MIIDCVFKQGDMCLAVNDRIENVKKTRGWDCNSDVRCGWMLPGATGIDRPYSASSYPTLLINNSITNADAIRKRKKRENSVNAR